ncbi:uncharacterized protein TRIVIDRAFT_213285 [Trichoderma virens Gv29-8]|uniref:Uncharacterized protein n=1 Tax=Hypocrea virens (strain Gv29-8 / FGSC 10586) TaxID=413071 RepID=G9MXG1_HYPVG|nr:uncharacterized protein TRIVIDRAFT_213285 [Trichoderma virens Gv29-8]EHK20859.1 hypothetical protein TRIVIDRAFT_213285 [Trichoderma virens Gv29-8]
MNTTTEFINDALNKIKHARSTRETLGSPKALDTVVKQLTTAESVLALVRDNSVLQTDAVRNEVKTVLSLARESDLIFDGLIKVASHRLPSILKATSFNEQLKGIHTRFDKALQQASSQILGVAVGLSGSQEDGYLVQFNTLSDINERVKKVLQKNLALMDFLQAQQKVQERDFNGAISLQPSDVKAFKERAWQKPNNQVLKEFSRASVYENTATSRLNIFTGNIGVEPGYVSSFNGTSTVHHNTMGSDSSIITGDIGGQAALEMMKHMWRGTTND